MWFSCVWGDGDSGSVGTNPEEPPEPFLKRRKTWKTNEFFQTGLEAGRDGRSVRCSRLKMIKDRVACDMDWFILILYLLLIFTYVLGLLGCSWFAGCHYFILFHHPVFSVCLPSCLRDELSISNRHICYIWSSLFIFYTIFSTSNVCWGEIGQGGPSRPSSCTFRPCSIWCRSRRSCDH